MRYLTIPFAAIIIFISLNIISWIGFIRSYQSLTHEEPILILHFEEKGKQNYVTYIEWPNSNRGEYILYGDQWRVDAQFAKIKYWANLFGIESRYEIDRLQGRYIDVQDENSLPNIAHQLTGENISHFTLFGWNPFIDIEYGSSVYQIVDVNKKFSVYKTPTGLIVRSEIIAPQEKKGWLNRFRR